MPTVSDYSDSPGKKHSASRAPWGMLFGLWMALLVPTVIPAALSQDSSTVPALAVASSFRALWPRLMQAYTSTTGLAEPRVSFGSSGLLTTQIRHGAPFDLFISADPGTVDILLAEGKTRHAGVTLALGTLALVRFKGVPVDPVEPDENTRSSSRPPLSMESLRQSIKRDALRQLAIPNPRHAPYGVAAMQALQGAGLWPLPPATVLNAENAAQTLQFVLTGAVTYAIVPSALVNSLPETLDKVELPAVDYSPVKHSLVMLQDARPGTQRLYQWLQGEAAAGILEEFGLQPGR